MLATFSGRTTEIGLQLAAHALEKHKGQLLQRLEDRLVREPRTGHAVGDRHLGVAAGAAKNTLFCLGGKGGGGVIPERQALSRFAGKKVEDGAPFGPLFSARAGVL